MSCGDPPYWWATQHITVNADIHISGEHPAMRGFNETAHQLYAEAHPATEHVSAANTDDAPEFRSGFMQVIPGDYLRSPARTMFVLSNHIRLLHQPWSVSRDEDLDVELFNRHQLFTRNGEVYAADWVLAYHLAHTSIDWQHAVALSANKWGFRDAAWFTVSAQTQEAE